MTQGFVIFKIILLYLLTTTTRLFQSSEKINLFVYSVIFLCYVVGVLLLMEKYVVNSACVYVK